MSENEEYELEIVKTIFELMAKKLPISTKIKEQYPTFYKKWNRLSKMKEEIYADRRGRTFSDKENSIDDLIDIVNKDKFLIIVYSVGTGTHWPFDRYEVKIIRNMLDNLSEGQRNEIIECDFSSIRHSALLFLYRYGFIEKNST